MARMTTWRKELTETLEDHGEAFDYIESITLTEEELDVEFHPGFGSEEGKPFTAWTASRVYFPWCYDGAEGVASVSRHPNGKPTAHIGGG